jgi:probable phosphoglycerate mutase
MTRFLLVRHGAHDLLCRGIIAGRQRGVHLNATGKKQAEQIAAGFSALPIPIDAVYSSPLERARETAAPLASKLRLPLQIADEFNEIDFGEWTSRAFVDLDDLPEWQRWNQFRSLALTPAGESMLKVQQRALQKIGELRQRHKFVAVFTHGDVIRAMLAYFLGVHLDLFQRIEVDAASSSLIELQDLDVRVRCINFPVSSSGFSSFFPQIPRGINDHETFVTVQQQHGLESRRGMIV